MNIQKLLISILFFIVQASLAFSAEKPPFLLPDEENVRMIINNRILAKVNDKPITVVDVMKKMDMVFYRQFPEYISSKTARFQFYQMTWKNVLQDLIDKELILADAEEAHLEVTSGDIRQEMEEIFGPNIIINLDKASLTMDEAWQMIHDDIVIRRMLIHNVNSKAVRAVGPQEIRKAYHEYMENFSPKEEWIYQVISIRHPEEKQSEEIATKLTHFQRTENIDNPSDLISRFKETEDYTPDTQITVSEQFTHNGEEIALNYKEILVTLEKGSFSKPVIQKGRSDNKKFYRIFFLKSKNVDDIKPFVIVSNEIKNKLLNNEMEKETIAYLDRLREHYAVKAEHLKEMVPSEFQPFSLRLVHN